MSALVQGVWSASVFQADPVAKQLYADSGSGIIFNFSGQMVIGHETLSEGVIMLPVMNKAENIVLSPGAQLAGIRFHPAIGHGVLGQNYEKPTLLSPEKDQLYGLYNIYSELRIEKDDISLISALFQWADKNFDFTNVIPEHLKVALDFIRQGGRLGELSENINMSQRQIERYFKFFLGITPKCYQRILRIKRTICYMRLHKKENLADIANQFGFSDQAHMTREFRAIALTTPRQT